LFLPSSTLPCVESGSRLPSHSFYTASFIPITGRGSLNAVRASRGGWRGTTTTTTTKTHNSDATQKSLSLSEGILTYSCLIELERYKVI